MLGRTLPPRSLLTPSAGRKGVPSDWDALFLSAGNAGQSSALAARLVPDGSPGYNLLHFVNVSPQPIFCDGCGIAASPEHIQQRLARLELATRFRPTHIAVLIVIASPDVRGDFYNAARPLSLRDQLLDGLGIASAPHSADAAVVTESRLAEFQRRGFYLAAVSECPLADETCAQSIARLAETLLKRIRLSYKPKAVVLVSESLAPILAPLADSPGIRVLPDGKPVVCPAPGDSLANASFHAACARIAEAART